MFVKSCDHDMGWILWAQRCSLPTKLAAWPLAQVHVMRSKFNLGGPNIVFFSHPLLCHYLSPRLIVTTEAFSRHTRPVITYISLVITFSVGESFHLRCVCEMVSMRRATAWLSAGDEQRDKSQLTSARTLPFFNYALLALMYNVGGEKTQIYGHTLWWKPHFSCVFH